MTEIRTNDHPLYGAAPYKDAEIEGVIATFARVGRINDKFYLLRILRTLEDKTEHVAELRKTVISLKTERDTLRVQVTAARTSTARADERVRNLEVQLSAAQANEADPKAWSDMHEKVRSLQLQLDAANLLLDRKVQLVADTTPLLSAFSGWSAPTGQVYDILGDPKDHEIARLKRKVSKLKRRVRSAEDAEQATAEQLERSEATSEIWVHNAQRRGMDEFHAHLRNLALFGGFQNEGRLDEALRACKAAHQAAYEGRRKK